MLDWLEEIAPVLAAQGNNDFGWEDPRMKPRQFLDVHGYRIAMVHDTEPEHSPIDYIRSTFLGGEQADVIITGHTHHERLDYRDGVLQINSGSATHPHLWSTRLGTVALLDVAAGRLDARIVRLGETPGRRNPGIEYAFSLSTGVVRLDEHPEP